MTQGEILHAPICNAQYACKAFKVSRDLSINKSSHANNSPNVQRHLISTNFVQQSLKKLELRFELFM
jgi:hypothetical protein